MQALSTHLESAITAESERIQNSIGSIQGSIASSTTTIGDLQQPSEVELLCPPACCDTAETSNSKEASVSGRIVLEGVLHGRAMVHKKDSVAAAVDMLKVTECWLCLSACAMLIMLHGLPQSTCASTCIV